MISQMNIVQNAARLAMDHRAAGPRKNPIHAKTGRGIFALAAVSILMLLAIGLYTAG